MKLQTVYVPVSVDERLPSFRTSVLISYDGFTFEGTAWYMESRTCMLAGVGGGNGYFGKGWATDGSTGCEKGLILDAPTHWLEEKSNVIVLTEEEFKKLVESAWKKGMKSFVVHVGAKKLMDDNDATNINKDLNDFIQSKLKP